MTISDKDFLKYAQQLQINDGIVNYDRVEKQYRLIARDIHPDNPKNSEYSSLERNESIKKINQLNIIKKYMNEYLNLNSNEVIMSEIKIKTSLKNRKEKNLTPEQKIDEELIEEKKSDNQSSSYEDDMTVEGTDTFFVARASRIFCIMEYFGLIAIAIGVSFFFINFVKTKFGLTGYKVGMNAANFALLIKVLYFVPGAIIALIAFKSFFEKISTSFKVSRRDLTICRYFGLKEDPADMSKVQDISMTNLGVVANITLKTPKDLSDPEINMRYINVDMAKKLMLHFRRHGIGNWIELNQARKNKGKSGGRPPYPPSDMP